MTLPAAPAPVPTHVRRGRQRAPERNARDDNGGSSPEDIVQSYSSLALADVYSVVTYFTYYLRNRAEVDAYSAEEVQRAAARSRHGVDEASLKLREQFLSRKAG